MVQSLFPKTKTEKTMFNPALGLFEVFLLSFCLEEQLWSTVEALQSVAPVVRKFKFSLVMTQEFTTWGFAHHQIKMGSTAQTRSKVKIICYK